MALTGNITVMSARRMVGMQKGIEASAEDKGGGILPGIYRI